MAKVKKSLHETEADLLRKKLALEKRLNAVQSKIHMEKNAQINELIIKHKLYEYDLQDLDLSFAKLTKELQKHLF